MENTAPLYIPIDDMTIDELNLELAKGVKSIEEGRVIPADEVEAMLKREFGI